MAAIVAAALARPSLLVGAKEMQDAWGRAPRGVDHVRVPAWDEDATTLGLDAAREALQAARLPASALRSIVVAGPDAALLAEALGAPRARGLAIGGPLAGVDALVAAFAVEAPCLVVAASVPFAPPGGDARMEEGAAGVAFVLAHEGPVQLLSHAEHARSVPARLTELGADEPLALAASRWAPPKEMPLLAAGALPPALRPQRAVADPRKDWGALGSLAPLVALVEGLRHGPPAGAWVSLADATPERAVVLALALHGAPALAAPRERARRVTPGRALQESRALAALEGLPDVPMGAYVPVGTWVEDLPARLRLLAQRCTSCGKTLYPPRGACPACRGASFEEVQLPPTAVVHAATRIGRGGAPSEFALEQAQVGAYWVGVVEWPEQGVRVTARLAGYDEHGPAIGDTVRAVVRRLFEQEGAVRYGVKFEAA